jgi:hypothetical protein
LTNVVLNDQFQKAFATAINNLEKANLGVSILGWHLGGVDGKQIVIDDPNNAYISTRSATLILLNQQTEDNTAAYQIFFAYQNLEKAANYARCAYVNQPASAVWFTSEANDWERLSRPWIEIVRPQAPQPNP